jgi:hypothetical protein
MGTVGSLDVATPGLVDFDAEEVWRFAFVHDDEDLNEETFALDGLEDDHLVEMSFEEGALCVGHGFTG